MDHAGRIARARNRLDGAGVDALFVTNLTNVRYLTGFSGTNGQALITRTGATFLSDPRYQARAHDLVRAAEIVIYPFRPTDVLPDLLAENKIQRLGVEGETMTIATRDDLAGRLEGVELVVTSKLIEELRRTKDADELALIKEAIGIAESVFEWALGALAPGVSERDVALELEVRMRKAGAEEVSFPPIVGSGPLSAHIHHTSGERRLEKGDLVLLDFGCRREGYCSDMTRTVVLGPPTDEQHDMYSTVLRAQAAGIAAAAAGKAAKEVDAAARRVVEATHPTAFGHGLGHGVGLDIHEAPRMNRDSEDTLIAGDVVTVEPGIYLGNAGGVRIEDCVVVSEQGVEVLGSAPKDDLIEL